MPIIYPRHRLFWLVLEIPFLDNEIVSNDGLLSGQTRSWLPYPRDMGRLLTCYSPVLWDKRWKRRLILDTSIHCMVRCWKDLSDMDGLAAYQLDGEVMAHHGDDG